MESYKNNLCDLCGSDKAEVIVSYNTNSSMTSDQRILERPLKKISCNNCGLIREGNDFDFSNLEMHYKKNYSLNTHSNNNEHMFFKNGEMISRSKAIALWISELIGQAGISFPERIYEVGAGQGNLLEQLQKLHGNGVFSGCEINENAVEIARNRGINIIQGGTSVITGEYDMIIAFGVLEHVPSPTKFINELKDHLLPGGYLLLGQPMQNVASYDIFFSDHLHHFHTRHLQYYADKTGFKEVQSSLSPWFANNFSLHLFKKALDKKSNGIIEYVNPQKVKNTITVWEQIFKMTSGLLGNTHKKIAIYGLSETATLLFCYGGLDKLDITYGIDDFPEKYESNIFNVTVKKPGDLTAEDIEKISFVILTLNPMYIESVTEKCNKMGLSVINIYEGVDQ